MNHVGFDSIGGSDRLTGCHANVQKSGLPHQKRVILALKPIQALSNFCGLAWVNIFIKRKESWCSSLRTSSERPRPHPTAQKTVDALPLKEKYINDAPWQSALIRGGSPWTQLFIGHRFSSGFMASDTPRKLVAERLLGNTLRGCQLSRHASCIIL